MMRAVVTRHVNHVHGRWIPARELSVRALEQHTNFLIGGAWVPAQDPGSQMLEVIDPSTEEPFALISLGGATDVDAAVGSARTAFEGSWGKSTLQERIDLLKDLADIYKRRQSDMADAIRSEMGAPSGLALHAQAAAGLGHIRSFIRELESFSFEKPLREDTPQERVLYEPIGVCGLITPWNWPMNQVALKVVPAVGVGCTVVLKPSEVAPISSLLFAEMMQEAGFPQGVFNLVNGTGNVVGEAISAHPDIDMVSFTGSTAAGVRVSKAAADTVKRVALELGGKGANLVFADVSDLRRAVRRGAAHCFNNTGQSCNAPTRMLVEASVYDEAVRVAKETAEEMTVGPPGEEGTQMGPLVSEEQFNRVQALIQAGIDEGAQLVAGGVGRPEGLEKGYYAKPTVFAGTTNQMRIAREEVFGPVLSMMPFEGEEEAVRIANETSYGLTDYVQSGDVDRVQRISRQLRAGMVQANGTQRASGSPFGGYKMSGNGREGGVQGLLEYLEVKTVSGWSTSS